jgi:hypothetical protein
MSARTRSRAAANGASSRRTTAEPRTSSRKAVICGESARSPNTRERTFQRIAGSADLSNASTMDSYTARLCNSSTDVPAAR